MFDFRYICTVFRPHNTVSSSATCGCKDGYSCCWQVGQSCFDSLNLMSNVRLYQRSIVWTVFLKCEVFPVKYFNVSVTSSDAMTSTTGAMTPTEIGRASCRERVEIGWLEREL